MKSPAKKKQSPAPIASTHRLEEMLNETEKELAAIEPQIEKLERQMEKLRELKLTKQKLITLKLSIRSILNNFSDVESDATSLPDVTSVLSTYKVKLTPADASQALPMRHNTVPEELAGKIFIPEKAFQQVNQVLRRRDSLNYELFRAIVYNGGQAGTEDIKAYLVEHRIKQPTSGEGFESVELTDISSRVNYLVRKGVVIPDGRGRFFSSLGWSD